MACRHLLRISGYLFDRKARPSPGWAIFFFASRLRSAAYLTVSETFPVEASPSSAISVFVHATCSGDRLCRGLVWRADRYGIAGQCFRRVPCGIGIDDRGCGGSRGATWSRPSAKIARIHCTTVGFCGVGWRTRIWPKRHWKTIWRPTRKARPLAFRRRLAGAAFETAILSALTARCSTSRDAAPELGAAGWAKRSPANERTSGALA